MVVRLARILVPAGGLYVQAATRSSQANTYKPRFSCRLLGGGFCTPTAIARQGTHKLTRNRNCRATSVILTSALRTRRGWVPTHTSRVFTDIRIPATFSSSNEMSCERETMLTSNTVRGITGFSAPHFKRLMGHEVSGSNHSLETFSEATRLFHGRNYFGCHRMYGTTLFGVPS